MVFVADLGTTVLKAALFTEEGKPVRRTERPMVLVPHPNPLYHETDASSWISAFREVIRDLGISREEAAEDENGEIPKAVVISGNGPTLVPVGEEKLPLDLAMTWMDRRGTKEAEKITELNGFYVDPTFYLPKAYWVFNHKKDIYAQTKYFFSCPEYLNYLLTGVAKTILPVPEYRPYIWTEDLVGKLGMDWEKFPDFVRPGDFIGTTVSDAGERFGLPEGIPVFAGGPDFIVSLLGTGTVVPGRACDRSGTSEGINLCTDKLVRDKRLICVSHVIEGLSNISGIISTSGKALEWFKNITGNRDTSYEEIFSSIEDVEPGSDRLIFLPYLAGERAPIWDPKARGAFIGLTLNHTRKEMTRAVIESVGYAIRHVIEVMEETGLTVHELRITGSQAKSDAWNQMKADITGKTILLPEMKDSELAGNTAIALYGLDIYSSLSEASEAAVTIEKKYIPVPERKAVYDEMFTAYLASYEGLRGVFAVLGNEKTEKENIQ